jgi:hypothetical protein
VIEPTIYHTRDKHANHYITDVVDPIGDWTHDLPHSRQAR